MPQATALRPSLLLRSSMSSVSGALPFPQPTQLAEAAAELPYGERCGPSFFPGGKNIAVGDLTSTIVHGNYNVTILNHDAERRTDLSEDGPGVSVDEIVAWLDGPDFLRICQAALAQRMPGTGMWFIESEEFRQLVEGRSIIVWGTGMPGAGKTVLSSFSFKHLTDTFQGDKGVAVLGVFLRYNERCALRDVFAALLCQLVKGHQCAYVYMKAVYARTQATGIVEQDLVEALRDIFGALDRVFVVIDGLDEVDDEVRDGLLHVLPSLGANVLILSRPLELCWNHVPGALRLRAEARNEDIDLFVEAKIKLSSKLQAILNGDHVLIGRLKARVRASADGMFLVAQLQMELVLQTARSVNSLFKALEQLPSNVDGIYRQTLERINAQSGEDASIAHQVFTWLLHAKEPLSIDDLQYALAISVKDKTYDAGNIIPVPLMLSMCGALVTVDEPYSRYRPRRRVRFIRKHFSWQISYLGH
ncbi:hypothetical protein D9611_008863 [Ephemerocybe angulata]|uniref:NACHT domain-containing protein n=1 Tax=Ephemerocybe angulata TaxID=980116 RepID=A0A8H5FCX4_9AGAR|nr:hypothetical protein D9611_008863 [Tulosesus angulatus]